MNDWIEWKGGVCPVERCTIIDVKYADEYEAFGVSALTRRHEKEHVSGGQERLALIWDKCGGNGEIIAYRLHNKDAATVEQPKQDMVNHPPHYQSDNGVECIDAIRAALGRDGFIAYCRGNAMKYIWRDKLDNVEDWNKAIWYLNKATEAKSE